MIKKYDALTNGLEKLMEYYSQLNKNPSFILALGIFINSLTLISL